MRDTVLTVLDCGLESQSHALVLAALGQFAQGDGFTRMSMTAIAMRARQNPKTVGRIVKRLADEDAKALAEDGSRDQLLVVAKPAIGRGQSGVYRVHWERLEIVAKAVRAARRSIMAGAEAALIESGFSGAPASAETCLGVLSALRQAVKAEGDPATASEILKLQSSLFDAMAVWPESALGGALEVGFEGGGEEGLDEGFDGGGLPVDNAPEKVTQNPLKGDAKSLKGDPASPPPTPPYKDSSPQGLSSGAQAHARGGHPAAGTGEGADGRFGEAGGREVHQLLTPQHFAALVHADGRKRALLENALLGARISESDRFLTVTVRSEQARGRVVEAVGLGFYGLFGRDEHHRWESWHINVREAS